MIYDLVPETDPILHAPVPTFVFNGPVDAVGLTNNLIETMTEHDGFGIAANQCGLPYRVFILLDVDKQPFAAFNPEIITRSEDQIALKEGCLSFPGLQLSVKRSKAVTLRAFDQFGREFEKKLEENWAVGVQHELDHLDGITFTKRVSRLRLQMAESKRR